MKTTITQTERLRVAEWITDARQLLAGAEAIEQQIAITLGLSPTDEDRDAITDAIGVPQTVDTLLERLNIGVDEG